MSSSFEFNPAVDAVALEPSPSPLGVELLPVGASVQFRSHPGAIKSSIVRALARRNDYNRTFRIEQLPDHTRTAPRYKVTRVA